LLASLLKTIQNIAKGFDIHAVQMLQSGRSLNEVGARNKLFDYLYSQYVMHHHHLY
jgi:hypothetical protein